MLARFTAIEKMLLTTKGSEDQVKGIGKEEARGWKFLPNRDMVGFPA
jgi:hypothetical protein